MIRMHHPATRRTRVVALVLFLLLSWVGFTACRGGRSTWTAKSMPTVVVTQDDQGITESCWVEIPPGTVIADPNNDGVIQIRADNVTLRFRAGSELLGAPPGTPWDQLKGIGIRVNGHRNVTVVGARVHGFRNGLVASDADELTVAGGDFSDNYRQHLKSTPAAEDGADWLFPHHNDETRWREEYGGAVCIERSKRVTVREVHVRRGQNGILLDRVEDSAVYDNDCSFLSGWGLALWRSSRNTISRNAFDFCIRGHSEGVYNRGQDSAGILAFEQCNDNVFAENSVTHGGDGFFGFAGREAIGEAWMNRERERWRKQTGREEVDDLIHPPVELVRSLSPLGCNRNLFLDNDFSYASAHGIEMTFSEGNQWFGNRVVENGICGFWGGYSSDSVLVGNEFAGNGGMAYGLERGAINMEHAAGNRIAENRFVDNKAAIHLWWNESALMRFPGVAGTERGVTENVIVRNEFRIGTNAPFQRLGPNEKLVVLQLRDTGRGHVRGNLFADNTVLLSHPRAVERMLDPGTEPESSGRIARIPRPVAKVLGSRHPVGARAALRGRDQILLDEWGPWDHERPMIRRGRAASGEPEFQVYGSAKPPGIEILSGEVVPVVVPGTPLRVRLRGRSGFNAYRLRFTASGLSEEVTGSFLQGEWRLKLFSWDAATDPREHLEDWRRRADGSEAFSATVGVLDLPYGMGGPRTMKLSEEITQRGPGNDHFGMVATARVSLPAGRWRFTTLSDDGVRVTVGGTKVLENWGWHGPTTDTGVYLQASAGEVEVRVEHFEIDGFSTLKVDLERVSE